MTKRGGYQLEMFLRVRDFAARHPDLFPETSAARGHLARLIAAAATLQQLTVSKLVADRAPDPRPSARASVTRQLLLITRAARRVALPEPGLASKFKMPERRSMAALLETARACVRDVEPVANRFVTFGLPETFVSDLRTSADALERAMRARRPGHTDAAAAQKGTVRALREGFDAILDLDVVMPNMIGNDPVLTAMWKRDRRVQRVRKRAARKAA